MQTIFHSLVPFKTKKEEVVKFKYPITYYHNNLLITKDKDVWAYYFIQETQVQLHDQEMKQEEIGIKQYIYHELGKNYKGIDLRVLPYEFNLKELFTSLKEDFNPEEPEIPNYYSDQTIKQLKHLYGDLTKDIFVLGVKLREYNAITSHAEAIKIGLEEVEKDLLKLLGGVTSDGKKLLEEFEQKENDLFQELSMINPIRLSTKALAYLQKRQFLRNTPHLRSEEEREQSFDEITEAILFPNVKRGVLGVQTEYGTQYLSFLPVSEFPDNLQGYDLFYLKQQFPFPCEYLVNAKSLESNDPFFGVKAKAVGKGKELKNSVRDMQASGLPVSRKLLQAKYKSEQVLQDLETEESFFRFSALFVVYGSTAKQCRARARSLRSTLRKMKVRVEMPLVDQEKLFHQCLVGAREDDIRYWKHFCTSHGLAEFLFGVSNALGNKVGWFLGVQTDGNRKITRDMAVKRSRKFVFWNPLANNQNISGASASPHIEVTGSTGNGKSFLLKLFFWILQLMDVRTLYFDPKVELEKITKELLSNKQFLQKYPLFVRMLKKIAFVTLDAKNTENHGVLDPVVFLPTNEAKTVAEDILSQVYDWKKDDKIRNQMMAALMRVLEDRQNGKEVGLRTWVTMLVHHRNPAIREVGEIFENEIQNSVLELIFSDGKNQTLSLDNRSTVLSIEGLTLPEPNQNPLEYTQSERNSIAVMCCVGEYIRLFGKQNPEQYTYEIFDESWVLSTSAIGRRIIKEIKKVGRAQCNGCIFASQSVKDTDSEEIQGQLGMIFAFDEASERPEILEKLSMPVTDENIELLKNLQQGQCLMKDSYSRVNKLSIHALFPEWQLANKTVKRTASGNLEEQYL